MLWHRQAIFKSKGDKLCFSAECRIQTQGLWNRIAADWHTHTHTNTHTHTYKYSYNIDGYFIAWRWSTDLQDHLPACVTDKVWQLPHLLGRQSGHLGAGCNESRSWRKWRLRPEKSYSQSPKTKSFHDFHVVGGNTRDFGFDSHWCHHNQN